MRSSMSVHNANHDRVLSVLNAIRREDKSGHGFCPTCTNAIVATALNSMSPHYYVEQQYDQELGSPWLVVETAVRDAIERLHAQPDHLCLRGQLKSYRRLTNSIAAGRAVNESKTDKKK